MTVNNKDFVVDNISINQPAIFNSNIVLSNVSLSINNQTNRLQAFINNEWVEFAMLSDVDPVNINQLTEVFDYMGEEANAY